nr:MAG TPA: hypothetical protein [Caudoviricetes sp.]
MKHTLLSYSMQTLMNAGFIKDCNYSLRIFIADRLSTNLVFSIAQRVHLRLNFTIF